LIIGDISNHELESPGSCLARTTPYIVYVKAQMPIRFPLAERPICGKLRVRFLYVPPTKNRTDRLLITSQELYIDVVMIPRLRTNKEIE